MTSSSHTAVLLLDLQNDLVHPDGKMAASGLPGIVAERRILHHARGVADRARAASIPIVYVGLAYRDDYADVLSVAPRIAGLKKAKIAVKDTWGSAFHSEIEPRDDDIVLYKQWVNPFFNTPLLALLARWSVRKLVLCGVATNLVVESAARFADDAGLAVTVLSDGCASPNPAWHDFAVQNTLPLFGRVMSAEQLLAEWQG